MCQSRLIVVIKIDTICLFYQICFNTLIAFVFSYFLHILKKIVYILFIILSSQKLVIRKLNINIYILYIYYKCTCSVYKKIHYIVKLCFINSSILNSAFRK